MINFYKVLGLSRNAKVADIKNGFKNKSLEIHPDRNSNRDKDVQSRYAEKQQQLLNVREQFETLSTFHLIKMTMTQTEKEKLKNFDNQPWYQECRKNLRSKSPFLNDKSSSALMDNVQYAREIDNSMDMIAVFAPASVSDDTKNAMSKCCTTKKSVEDISDTLCSLSDEGIDTVLYFEKILPKIACSTNPNESLQNFRYAIQNMEKHALLTQDNVMLAFNHLETPNILNALITTKNFMDLEKGITELKKSKPLTELQKLDAEIQKLSDSYRDRTDVRGKDKKEFWTNLQDFLKNFNGTSNELKNEIDRLNKLYPQAPKGWFSRETANLVKKIQAAVDSDQTKPQIIKDLTHEEISNAFSCSKDANVEQHYHNNLSRLSNDVNEIVAKNSSANPLIAAAAIKTVSNKSEQSSVPTSQENKDTYQSQHELD